MEIKKDTILLVRDIGKGAYKAKALGDFDTEKDEWYPVATLERVEGLSTTWEAGDKIPCRRGLARFQVISQPQD